jgi:hypothetical protein
MWGLDEQRSLIASGHSQAYGDSTAAHPGNKGEQDDCEHGRDPPSKRGSKYNPRAARAPMTYELFLIGRLASITNDRHGREEEKNPARMGVRLEASPNASPCGNAKAILVERVGQRRPGRGLAQYRSTQVVRDGNRRHACRPCMQMYDCSCCSGGSSGIAFEPVRCTLKWRCPCLRPRPAMTT